MVIKFPCAVCKKCVKKNQKALQCDICDLWVHISCNNIPQTKYSALIHENTNSTDAMHKGEAFYCIKCINEILPFGSIDQNLFHSTNLLGQNLETNTIEDLSITIDKDTQKQIDHITMLIREASTSGCTSFCNYVNIDKFNKLLIKNPSAFKIFHLNIASLQYHIAELQILLSTLSCQIDILSITETKLRTNIKPVQNIDIPGYTIAHTPTDATKGGTLLYISEKYNYKPRKDLEMNISKQIESTFIEIVNPSGQNNIIGSIYKHHTITQREFTDNFELLLAKLRKENKPTYLTGDFNIDLLQIDKDFTTEQFYDKLTEKHFMPLITIPTRIVKSSKTLIDNIFTNRHIEGTTSGNLTVGISDHMPQFCIIPNDNATNTNNKVKYKRDFSHFDSNKFMEEINQKPIESNLNVTDYTEKFIETMSKLVDKHAPVRKMNQQEMKRLEKPWITEQILKKIKKKDSYYKKFTKENDSTKKEVLNKRIKTMKNEITQMIRKAKHNHYKQFFLNNNSNTRELWKGVNEIIHTKSKNKSSPTCINTKINQTEVTVTDKSIIANTFNNYYAQVAEDLIKKRRYKGNKHFSHYLKDQVQKSFMMQPTTPQEVDDIIMNMDPSKKTGPYSIPPKIIKKIIPSIAYPISEICNKSFSEGICPGILKTSNIIPIFKKDSRLNVENYRPISLLSNITKIIEKIMFTRLYKFLDHHKCLYSQQFGFRAKHSTTHAVLSMIQEIRETIENDDVAVGVFVDFKKAFDTVNHEILLTKMEHYGIRGLSNKWFCSYLSNRKQYVTIDATDSSYEYVRHGVPQGSVLGPLLFLIYINDLNQCIKNSTTRHFADATNILHIIRNKQRNRNPFRKLNNDLRALTHWLLANKISLNKTKTEVVIFRKKTTGIPPGKIILNGLRLEYQHSTKYVGLILDEHLNFKVHIDTLNARLRRANNLLSICRHYVPKEILHQIYYGQFHSHLSYGCQIWTTANDLQSTIVLQRKALRIITWSEPQTSATPLFKQMQILELEDIVKMNNLLFVHDILNDRAPETILSLSKDNTVITL